MGTLPDLMRYVWAFSAIVQLCVFYLVVAKRHYRNLPLFTAYIALNLCQAVFLVFVYSRFGFSSEDSRQLFWISEALTLVAQTLAATELLHHILRRYRGIWGLAWRLIATATFLIVCFAWASARQQTEWGLMIANRGYHLTFAVTLISCLLLIRFYCVPVNPVYKALLGGFCFFSCGVVIANSLFQWFFSQQVASSGDIWNYCEVVMFACVQIAWAVVLRRPAQALEDAPAMLPASAYTRLSPEINSRLRLLNDDLCKFWRLEVPRP